MVTKKQIYIDKMERQLSEWSAQLDATIAIADKVIFELGRDFSQKIASIRADRAEINEKLINIKAAGDNSWENMTEGADRAWAKVKDAFVVAR